MSSNSISAFISNKEDWKRVPTQTEFAVTKRRSHPSAPFKYSCSGLISEQLYSVFLKIEPVRHGSWKYNKEMREYVYQNDNKTEDAQSAQFLPLSPDHQYILGSELMANGLHFDKIFLSKDESHLNPSTFIVRTVVLYRTTLVIRASEGREWTFTDKRQEFIATGSLSERYEKRGKKRAAKEAAEVEPKSKKPVQEQDEMEQPMGMDGHYGVGQIPVGHYGAGQGQQEYQEHGHFVQQDQAQGARGFVEHQDQQRDLDQHQQMMVYDHEDEEEVYEFFEEDFEDVGLEQVVQFEEGQVVIVEEHIDGLYEEFIIPEDGQHFQPVLFDQDFQDQVAHQDQVYPMDHHQFQGLPQLEVPLEEEHFLAPFAPIAFAHQGHQYENFVGFAPVPVQEDFMLNDHFYGHHGQQHFEPYFPEQGQMNHQVFGVFGEGAEFNGPPQMGY